MMRTLFSFAAGTCPAPVLARMARPVAIFPFYHTVSDAYLPHIHPLYPPKSLANFERDLDFLSKHFEFRSIQAIRDDAQTPGHRKKSACHLSFDDGLRGVYETAMPLLFRKGIPATIFINSDFTNNRHLFYRHKAALLIDRLHRGTLSGATQAEAAGRLALTVSETPDLTSAILALPYPERQRLDALAPLFDVDFQTYLDKNKPYLTVSELKEMQKKGFTIGAHSVDHPPFAALNEKEQVRQTLESCRFVKETFHEPATYFSFPFSDEAIRDSFFERIDSQVDLTFGIAGLHSRNRGKHLGRIDMERYGKTAKTAINKAILKYLIQR
jgi:peptidoglycan/xylan/chitin deacetylase (PgdA/CDA1 family)